MGRARRFAWAGQGRVGKTCWVWCFAASVQVEEMSPVIHQDVQVPLCVYDEKVSCVCVMHV